MVRNIDGYGRLMTKAPASSTSHFCPCSFTTSAIIPGSGKVQDPGLVAITPGTGASMIEPVSVCHQVSTIGHLPFPTTS